MTCQIDALQIDPRYKEALGEFCLDPQNEDACRQICELPPEVLAQKIEQIESQLQDWTVNGVPPELEQAAVQQDPQAAAEMGSFLQNEAPQIMEQEIAVRGGSTPPPQSQPTQSFAQGGLAQQGRFGDDSLAHVDTGEVIVPKGVFAQNPGLRQGLGDIMLRSGADPRYYTVGNERNRVNPQTGLREYGFLGKVLGAAVGFAVGGPAGAWAGAGLGATAGGMLIDGDSFGEAAMWGVGVYTGGSLLAGSGAFGSVYQAGAASWAGGGGLSAAGLAGATEAAAATSSGLGSLSSAELAAGAAEYAGPAAFEGTLGSSIGMPTIASNTGAVLADVTPIAAEGAAATPSLMSQAGDWIMDNKLQAGLLGATALGAMAEEPVTTAPQDGITSTAEGWAYNDCLGSGNSIEACRAQHPKGYAGSLDAVPQSAMLAGTGNMGQVTAELQPTQQNTMESQPWYQQSQQFFAADGGFINGAGTETSDSIPARLSDNEFVLTADAVRGAGNGSVQRGAKKLYDLMDRLERRAT